jgi:hypothetical protein
MLGTEKPPVKRDIEQYRKCDPATMAKMSEAAIFHAINDMRADILALYGAIHRCETGSEALEGTAMNLQDLKDKLREDGYLTNGQAWELAEKLLPLIAAEVAAEREACAKVCEEYASEAWDQEGGALSCAERIRAR